MPEEELAEECKSAESSSASNPKLIVAVVTGVGRFFNLSLGRAFSNGTKDPVIGVPIGIEVTLGV